jgi:predicted metal-dependent phosphoesterase TrpH
MDRKNRILFEKPDLEHLTANYAVVDLHFHTHYSDGITKVADIAERAASLGIGVAITDHNEIRGAVELDECKSILSIPGIEITSKEGSHVLVYFHDIKSLKKFYRDDVEPFMGNDVMHSIALEMEEIIHRARKYETLTIFPHPYSVAYTGICNLQFPPKHLDQLLSLADGVEVINSHNLKKWNLKCAVLGFNLDKGITGGSDGHMLHHLGRVVSYAACENKRKPFLESIQTGNNKVVGKEIDILRKVTSNSVKLKSNLRNYPDFVEKNIRYGRTLIHAKSKQLRENVKRTIDEGMERIQNK